MPWEQWNPLASWWRQYANTTEGSGPWKRRAATALGRIAGSGGWARRIAQSQMTIHGPWTRELAQSASGTGSWMRRAVENGGNVPDFTPQDIVDIYGSAVWWYDPTDISTLWQDAAMTIPVTAPGQSVRAIMDKGPGGNHLTVLTGTVGVYQVDNEGRGYIDHTNGAGSLYRTGLTIAQPVAMYAAATTPNAPLMSASIFSAGSATNRIMAIQGQTNAAGAVVGILRNVSGTNSGNALKCVAKPGLPFVGSFSLRDSIGRVAGNNMPTVTETPIPNATDTGMTNWRLGYGNAGHANNGLARFHGGLFVNGVVLTATEDRQLRQYLMRQCGLLQLESKEYDVFLGCGQSNLVGWQGQLENFGSPFPAFGTAAEWLEGVSTSDGTNGSIAPLADPVRSSDRTGIGRSGSASLIPAFAERYTALTGRNILFINGAAGSQGLTSGTYRWTLDTLMDDMLPKYLAMKAQIEASGGKIRSVNVLWLGGEADAVAGVNKATFKAAFINLLPRLRAKFTAPDLRIFVISIDRNKTPANDAGFAVIREALVEVCNENAGFDLVCPYQDFVGQDKLIVGDNVHWTFVALNEAGTIAGTTTAGLVQ